MVNLLFFPWLGKLNLLTDASQFPQAARPSLMGPVGFPSPGYPRFWLYLKIVLKADSLQLICSGMLCVNCFHPPPFRRVRRVKNKNPIQSLQLGTGM
jgi:hypothetical protein